jgi:hypothetical protein
MSENEDQARAQALLERLAENRRLLDVHLKVGDVLTHTRCMGCLEEHVFTGRDGIWLCGTPTADTRKMDRLKGGARANAVNDISPVNVTHLNRVPLENVPFLASLNTQEKSST